MTCGEHDASDNVIMFLFSEFGRACPRQTAPARTTVQRARPFVIGDPVKGGQYSEYPSREPQDLQQGDLVPNTDFRGVYSTILEDWLGLGP